MHDGPSPSSSLVSNKRQYLLQKNGSYLIFYEFCFSINEQQFVLHSYTIYYLLFLYCSKAMNCIYVDRLKRNSNASNNLAQGVAAQVRQRMLDTAAGKLPGARPMLLFPEATTTNGKYLLPFKTGAFLAGCPLRPVIIQYKVNHISPCWESIGGIRHIILMMCNPIHEVTCYEFPVYYPSDEEKKDAKLYADNVRDYMVSHDCTSSEILDIPLFIWVFHLMLLRVFSGIEVCISSIKVTVDIAPPFLYIMQLKCSGLQPSTATYEDKVEFHAAMKRKHIQTPLRDDQTLKTKSKGTHKD